MRDATPRLMRAKFKSICPETGRTIQPGEEIAWYPKERKAYAHDSKHANDVRALAFAKQWNMPDENW